MPVHGCLLSPAGHPGQGESELLVAGRDQRMLSLRRSGLLEFLLWSWVLRLSSHLFGFFFFQHSSFHISSIFFLKMCFSSFSFLSFDQISPLSFVGTYAGPSLFRVEMRLICFVLAHTYIASQLPQAGMFVHFHVKKKGLKFQRSTPHSRNSAHGHTFVNTASSNM